MHNIPLVYFLLFLFCLGLIGLIILIVYLLLNKERELNNLVFLWMLIGFISCIFFGFMYNTFTNPQYFNSFIKLNFNNPYLLAFIIVWSWRAVIFFLIYTIIFRITLMKFKKHPSKRYKIFPLLFFEISTVSLAWITDFEKLLITKTPVDLQHILHWFGGITGCLIMALFMYVFIGDKIIKYLEIKENFQKLKNKFLFVFLTIVSVLILDIFGLLIGCLNVDSYSLILTKIGIYCIIFLIPLILIILKFTNEFSINLNQSVNFLKYVAEQDLTKSFDIKSNDEFGFLGNSLLLLKNNLKNILLVVESSSKEVKASAVKVNDFISSLVLNIENFINLLQNNSKIQKDSSETAEIETNEIFKKLNLIYSNIQNQSSFVEKSSNAIELMSSIINNISEKTNDANKISINLYNIANEGNSTIDKSLSSIKDIEASSNKINDIISIINEISSKIKILAINTAIESSNAGESGKGFSVISKEMRKLADSTKSNAQIIKKLLEEILKKISNAFILFEKSRDYFINIHDLVNKTKIINQDIEISMNEEREKIKEILDTTKNLVKITNDITNSSEYLNKANESIKEIFVNLKILTEKEKASINNNSTQISQVIQMMNELSKINLEIAEKLNILLDKFKIETF